MAIKQRFIYPGIHIPGSDLHIGAKIGELHLSPPNIIVMVIEMIIRLLYVLLQKNYLSCLIPFEYY